MVYGPATEGSMMGARGDSGGTVVEVGVAMGDSIPSNIAASANNPRSDFSCSNSKKREVEGKGTSQRGFSQGSSS